MKVHYRIYYVWNPRRMFTLFLSLSLSFSGIFSHGIYFPFCKVVIIIYSMFLGTLFTYLFFSYSSNNTLWKRFPVICYESHDTVICVELYWLELYLRGFSCIHLKRCKPFSYNSIKIYFFKMIMFERYYSIERIDYLPSLLILVK